VHTDVVIGLITPPHHECGVLWWTWLFVCLSVCLSACIPLITSPNFTKFSAAVHGSVIHWRRTLRTSGFVDDAVFNYNGIYSGVMLVQQTHRSVVHTPRQPCCVLVASFPSRRRAPRLDESILQGVPWQSVRWTVEARHTSPHFVRKLTRACDGKARSARLDWRSRRV